MIRDRLGVLALARLYKDRFGIAVGVMLPAWKDLNKEADQQGSEGLENYRLVGTFSYLF